MCGVCGISEPQRRRLLDRRRQILASERAKSIVADRMKNLVAESDRLAGGPREEGEREKERETIQNHLQEKETRVTVCTACKYVRLLQQPGYH